MLYAEHAYQSIKDGRFFKTKPLRVSSLVQITKVFKMSFNLITGSYYRVWSTNGPVTPSLMVVSVCIRFLLYETQKEPHIWGKRQTMNKLSKNLFALHFSNIYILVQPNKGCNRYFKHFKKLDLANHFPSCLK